MAKEKQAFNGYKLSKDWFDFVIDNPDLVSGNHTALYLWLVELNNRLSWVEKFGLSVREGMDGMACKSRETYSNCFKDLVFWGFIELVKEGKNQYVCNTIALVKNVQPRVQHRVKHRNATSKSTGTHPKTIKLLNLETIETEVVEEVSEKLEDFNEALDELFNPEKNNPKEEKSSAKKEKIFPSLELAMDHVGNTAYWRTVSEHHKIAEDERAELFKIFYEQKEDHYRVRFPTWTDMAQNFYHWVPIHKAKDQLQGLIKNGKKPPDRGPAAVIDKFTNLKMNEK